MYGIPDLELDLKFFVYHDGLGGELNAHGHVVLIGKLSFDVLGEHRGLANACIREGLPW
jgi:hypothetical protein